MKKIGVIFGMETTFPPALVDRINAMGEAGITAELGKIGEVRMAEVSLRAASMVWRSSCRFSGLVSTRTNWLANSG